MSGNTEKVVAPKTSWFKGLKSEFTKIIWPDKKSLGKQTLAVTLASVAAGLLIAGLDVLIQYAINFIVNL